MLTERQAWFLALIVAAAMIGSGYLGLIIEGP